MAGSVSMGSLIACSKLSTLASISFFAIASFSAEQLWSNFLRDSTKFSRATTGELALRACRRQVNDGRVERGMHPASNPSVFANCLEDLAKSRA